MRVAVNDHHQSISLEFDFEGPGSILGGFVHKDIMI